MTKTETALAFIKHYKWEEVIDTESILYEAYPMLMSEPAMLPKAVCICNRYDADSIEREYEVDNGNIFRKGGSIWKLKVYISTTVSEDLWLAFEGDIPQAGPNDLDPVSEVAEEALQGITAEKDPLQEIWASAICNTLAENYGCCGEKCFECPIGAAGAYDEWQNGYDENDDDD